MASDAENQLDRMENQHMDLGEDLYCIPEEKGILEQIKHRKPGSLEINSLSETLEVLPLEKKK